MSSESVKRCEARIAEVFHRRYCLLTGNGTTALTLAIRLASPDKPHVLLPAMACFNIVMAVYFAGKTPIFADVKESDATLDPAAVERALKNDPDIGAVLIVHLYGHPARTRDIISICRARNVVPIEDPAQAMGGCHPGGEPLGALGDMAIVSFGHTKILDVGGGGALLTDDQSLHAQASEQARLLPAPSRKTVSLERTYRQLYYAIWEAGTMDRRFFTLFDDLPMKFQDLFIFRRSDADVVKIDQAMDTLETVFAERRNIANIYQSELHDMDGIRFFGPLEGGVPWRFTFRMDPCIREDVFKQVRQSGFDISGWYPCLTEWTPSGRKQGLQAFPVAKRLEQEVVNLWVAEGYTLERALETAQALKEAIESAFTRSGNIPMTSWTRS